MSTRVCYRCQKSYEYEISYSDLVDQKLLPMLLCETCRTLPKNELFEEAYEVEHVYKRMVQESNMFDETVDAKDYAYGTAGSLAMLCPRCLREHFRNARNVLAYGQEEYCVWCSCRSVPSLKKDYFGGRFVVSREELEIRLKVLERVR